MAKSRALILSAGVLALLATVGAHAGSADEQTDCPVNSHTHICEEKKCTSDSDCEGQEHVSKCCQHPSCGGRCTRVCREKCTENYFCALVPDRFCRVSKGTVSCSPEARCMSKLCIDKSCWGRRRCRMEDGHARCVSDSRPTPGVCQKPRCLTGATNYSAYISSCRRDADCYRQGEKCCNFDCKEYRCLPACESQCPAGQECKWTTAKAAGEKPKQKAVCTPRMDTKER